MKIKNLSDNVYDTFEHFCQIINETFQCSLMPLDKLKGERMNSGAQIFSTGLHNENQHFPVYIWQDPLLQ